MNSKQNSYVKTEMYKKVPLHFSMVTSTFPNFPVENLESTLRANNANCIIWVKYRALPCQDYFLQETGDKTISTV